MGVNDFILDGMRWSYSSVNCYHGCPRAFKLGYLDALPREGNAFSDWGTFMHSLMEKYLTGEMEFFELSQAYVDGYEDAIQHKFPPNKFVDLSKSYYEKGKEFLDQFDGLLDDCEIIAVEERVKLNINGRPFVGVLDVLAKHGDELWIVDHKSKSKMTKTDLAAYGRQLYIYALYVYEKYGKWPTKLIFHMVRAGGIFNTINFKMDEMEAAKKWFLDTIDAIYADVEFETKPNLLRRELRELRRKQESGEIGFSEYTKQKKKLEAELKGQSFFCWQLCSNKAQCPNQDKAPVEK